MRKYFSAKNALFFFFITILLTSSFFENRWHVVETEEYAQWQRGWESLLIARLVKSRQDGMFSAGGLTGIGDVTEWDLGNRTIAHQYEIYENGGEFRTYLPYKSFPGFQGFFFSGFDALTNFPAGWNIKLFRGAVAVFTSMTLALLLVGLSIEFGWGTSALVLVFIALSKWFALPAGNIYWNLWSFYLPPVLIMFYLALTAKKGVYPEHKIHWMLFITTLIKILFSGFEFITTQLLMSTVPFVYFSMRDHWGLKVFSRRMLRAGLVLLAATFTGLVILMLQIFALEGSFSGATAHILNTINLRAIGKPETLPRIYAESMRVGLFSIIWEYLNIPAVGLNFLGWDLQITFLHLILLFAIFTGIFVFKLKTLPDMIFHRKGKALVVSTWYAILAPLSWLVIFKPHSYLHTFLNPIIWQMPFTLLGLAFCGFTFSSLTRRG